MNPPSIFLIAPGIGLFIYIVLSSIEFGGSIFSVFPSLMSDESAIKTYMNPLWETTTIFLVFALVSLFTFFPGATPVWSLGLFSILFCFLLAMGIRVVCILLLHYGTFTTLVVRLLYAASCFASAIIGMLICFYFLVGTWHLPIRILFSTAFTTVFAVITVAASFFRAFTKDERMLLTHLVRASGTIFFMLATGFFMLMLGKFPFLGSGPNIQAIVPSVLIAAILLAVGAEKMRSYWLSFLSFVIALGALFFGFLSAHLPYIVYPSVTMAASVTNPASIRIFEISFCIGGIFVIPALVLLYKLFFVSPKSDASY